MSDYIREAFDSDNAAQKNIALRKASNEIWFLRAENERLREVAYFYSCDCGLEECSIESRESLLCGYTARAALEQKS